MRVTQLFGKPTTNPKRGTFGITIVLRGGDVCHPLGEGKWFEPPYFDKVLRFWMPLPLLPFISWNLFGWRGYLGAKAYGADRDPYKNWMKPKDVYEGSVAIQLSARLSIND